MTAKEENQKRFEEYEYNCTIFKSKIRDLINKKVKEIFIPYREYPHFFQVIPELIVPEANVFLEARFEEINYVESIAKVLKDKYGIKIRSAQDVIHYGIILKLEKLGV
jgi:hypothetical protein